MTTIAVCRNEKAVIADRQQTFGEYPSLSDDKIIRIVGESEGTYAIIGACGRCVDTNVLMDWGQNNVFKPWRQREKYPKVAKTSTVLLYSTKDGGATDLLEIYDSDSARLEICDQRFAMGSGAAVCVGALKAGVSLVEALDIASQCDIYTGMGYVLLYLASPTRIVV